MDEAAEERVRDELGRGSYLLFNYAGHGSYNPDSPEKGALYLWEATKGKSEVKKLTASQLESLVHNAPLTFCLSEQLLGGSYYLPSHSSG